MGKILNENLIFLCDLNDIPEGRGLKVCSENRRALAVFKHDEGVSVTDEICTHGYASLAEGEVDGVEVECPLHSGAFNLITGEPTEAPCSITLLVHQCVVKNNKVYLVNNDG